MDVEVSVTYLELEEGYSFAFLHDISGRKRTEEKLAMLAHAVESTSEPICITDLQDRFIFVNRAFHKTYGYTDAEILGKTPHEIVSPRNPPALLSEILEQSHLGGWRGEILDVRKDGTEFPVALSSSQIKDRIGRVIGLMGVAQDITERKRADAALRESERHHRLLFETMLQGVVYQDVNGKVISMNPAAERILGKTLADFLRQTSESLQHPAIREDGSPFPGVDHPAMVALRTGRKVSDVVMGVYNPELKARRWIDITAVPLFEPDAAEPFQVYTIFHDITEPKKAQDALREAHRRTSDILESISDGFNSFDRQWRYTYVNASAAKTTRSTPEQLLGKTLWETWPMTDQLRFGSEFRRAMETNQPTAFEEFYPEPLNLWFEVRCYPAAAGLSIFFRDITERKRSELEVTSLREKLAQVDRLSLMGELTAALAHEVNQPLTAIMSNAQAAQRFLLSHKDKGEDFQAILKDIISDTKRAAGVIQGVRSLMAPHSRAFVPLDLNELVREVATLVRSDLLINQVALTCEQAPSLPNVSGDRIHLQQVLLNLILNAIDALKTTAPGLGRQVLVRTSPGPGPCVTVAVTDTGPGLQPEHQPRLFDSFFTTKPGGMGMGLSVCRSIIEAHGGRIEAKNNLDSGATFQFSIPSVESEKGPHE